jgi:hypothetical protein
MEQQLPKRPETGTSGKYGRILAERGDPGRDGEPVFVLRGQDMLAGLAIRAYWALCVAANCDDAHLNGVEAELSRFADWAAAHEDRLKVPGS